MIGTGEGSPGSQGQALKLDEGEFTRLGVLFQDTGFNTLLGIPGDVPKCWGTGPRSMSKAKENSKLGGNARITAGGGRGVSWLRGEHGGVAGPRLMERQEGMCWGGATWTAKSFFDVLLHRPR